ncbi:MAG TPA: TraM recognition domain-containing protein [Nocardioides sp.]
MNTAGRPVDDTLVNLALVAIGAAGAAAALLRGAAALTAWVSRKEQPTAGWAAGIRVIGEPTDPGGVFGADISPWVYWTVLSVLVAAFLAAGFVVWRKVDSLRHKSQHDPRRLVGVATRTDVATVASKKALLARSTTLRPSLTSAQPSDVGYLLGRSRGMEVWASVEDSILLLGPPRSGKGVHVVINAILDAPGAVVTTATRPDNIAATITARQKVGPVAVFDPQRLAEGLPSGLRWSPVRGCEDPLTAMIRATGLASATGLSAGSVESGGFWEGKTRTALQSLLHAAALDHRTPAELFAWTLSPSSASDAVAILASHPSAAAGWGESLESMIHSDARTRDSIWMGVSLALSCLADPRVLDAVTPRLGEHFDPVEFLTGNGTLYLLATGAGAGASWSLVVAFIEDLVETARRLAAASAGARLDPPLLLALDEIGNLSPLPSLPVLMAEGGGTGITTMPVLQSLSQARDKWGDHAAGAIWDASIAKIILGGTSSARDLQDLSALIGERDEKTDTISVGDYGSRSLQRSTRRVAVLPPEAIRTLPFGTALVLLRSSSPLVTDLRPWTDRSDASQMRADRAATESALGQ